MSSAKMSADQRWPIHEDLRKLTVCWQGCTRLGPFVALFSEFGGSILRVRGFTD